MMDDASLLASFMAHLEPHSVDGAPAALRSICGTRDVEAWRRRHVLRPTTERIAIRIADEKQALWQGPYFGVRVLFDGPMRIELVLPPEFRSMDAMRSFLDRRGATFFDIILRLRDIMLGTCDMLLADRLDFTLAVRSRLGQLPVSLWFRVSPEDKCQEPSVVTTSRDIGANNIVIPDCHYYEGDGYAAHLESVACATLPWARRSNVAIWRGTTTGASFTADDLERNDRIRLATACATRPDLFDVKISHVAQVPEATIPLVRARLEERGLLAASVPMEVFSRHKFALHIDGNGSAASFFEKLALACCVLRVASPLEAWFEPRIAPWEHFVPIAADLHDLIDTTEMLTRTPILAERIARAGYAIAVAASFRDEARQFCRALVAALGDPDTIRVTHAATATSALRLGAPEAGQPGNDTLIAGDWHAAETHGNLKFRWTRATRIGWTTDPGRIRAGTLKVTIPVVNEIEPGFAAGCRLEVGDRVYKLLQFGQSLQADIETPDGFDGRIALLTAPPMSPKELGHGDDTRMLGVAVAVEP